MGTPLPIKPGVPRSLLSLLLPTDCIPTFLLHTRPWRFRRVAWALPPRPLPRLPVGAVGKACLGIGFSLLGCDPRPPQERHGGQRPAWIPAFLGTTRTRCSRPRVTATHLTLLCLCGGGGWGYRAPTTGYQRAFPIRKGCTARGTWLCRSN